MRICLLCIVKQTDVYGYITERFKSLMHFFKKKIVSGFCFLLSPRFFACFFLSNP